MLGRLYGHLLEIPKVAITSSPQFHKAPSPTSAQHSRAEKESTTLERSIYLNLAFVSAQHIGFFSTPWLQRSARGAGLPEARGCGESAAGLQGHTGWG